MTTTKTATKRKKKKKRFSKGVDDHDQLRAARQSWCSLCTMRVYKLHIFYHIICSSVTIQMTLNELQALLFLSFALCFIFSPFNLYYFFHRIPIIIIIYFRNSLATGEQEIFSVSRNISRFQIHNKFKEFCHLPFAMHITIYGCCFVSHTG